MMLQTVMITVRGKVQGVFFRQSTKDFAIQNHITGQVKNVPDGSVAIIATGTSEQLQLLEQWCHKGPARAKVTAVIVTTTDFTRFEEFVVLK